VGTSEGADLISTGCIDGYATEFNRQQHVHYIASNLDVYELLYSNQWRLNDITQLSGASITDPASVFIDGYATEYNGQQHVNFIGSDNHVYELLYDGAWHHNDLTQLTGAPAAAPPQPIDGYATEFNRQQHVNFIGNDNHVHELHYDGSWRHNDLTQLTGAPAAPLGSYLAGYATEYNRQRHVNFVGADGHVHELFHDRAWHHDDLTQLMSSGRCRRRLSHDERY
jgi:hypothetical protein